MSVFSAVSKKLAEGAQTRLKAYHGSPHDFDEFSTEAIGTGEGAQAYGHGLYFAEREGTAKSYRDALTEPRFTFDGKPADAIYTNEIRERWADVYDELIDDDLVQDWKLSYLDSVAENGGDYDKASEALDSLVEKVLKGEETTYDFDRLDEFGSDVDPNGVYDLNEPQRHLDSVLANMSQADSPSTMDIVLSGLSPEELRIYERYVEPRVEYIKPEGKMYEVDIDASPDDLLDYDLPLNEQSDEVKKRILNLGLTDLDGNKYTTKELDALGFRGQNLYEKLSSGDDARASARLKDVGIKGIKYADAQTRFSPKGKTHNYVVFDDKLVEIARKYGVTMPVAGAILAGTITPEQAQAGAAETDTGEKNYDAIYAERDARKMMSPRERKNAPPASEALRNHTLSTMFPSLGNAVQGLVRGGAETLDYLHPANLARLHFDPANEGLSRFISPSIVNPVSNLAAPVVNPVLYDKDDPEAVERAKQAKEFGALFSPI